MAMGLHYAFALPERGQTKVSQLAELLFFLLAMSAAQIYQGDANKHRLDHMPWLANRWQVAA